MPWTNVIFQKDVDKDQVGSLTAIFNKGLADEFTYGPERVDGIDGAGKFVADAKAALAAHNSAQTKAANIEAQILAALNK